MLNTYSIKIWPALSYQVVSKAVKNPKTQDSKIPDNFHSFVSHSKPESPQLLNNSILCYLIDSITLTNRNINKKLSHTYNGT